MNETAMWNVSLTRLDENKVKSFTLVIVVIGIKS